MILFKKFIRFILKHIINKFIAKQKADRFINSVHISTKSKTKGTVISEGKCTLLHMKEIGIKKVELICSKDCECCKDLKNTEILIEKAIELPHINCSYDTCTGRYCAVVEFDLN